MWYRLRWAISGLVVGVLLASCRTQEEPLLRTTTSIPREWILVPQPREVDWADGAYLLEAHLSAWCTRGASTTDDVVHSALSIARGDSPVPADAICPNPCDLAIDPAIMRHPQGYRLTIAPESIEIIAHDGAGLYYGAQTLVQIARQASGTGALPCVMIRDWPDFPVRGIMLDVTREKVPTMETLYAFIDKMAEWKCNQLQLYTEHAFAYAGHHEVWEDASPMTPTQIRALDAYCAERFIELVPNQNSFGHMRRWLQHDAYKHLAELPDGHDLCPTDPGSIELLRSLYGQLLPCFSSGMVNVGCDETYSVGKGRSKQQAEELGVGRVYLDFLLQIHQIVSGHGKRMQFWGDIVLDHPELIPELPKDIIALEWGYRADHAFDERGRKFADAGIEYYVCPGTSTWNSVVGRTSQAMGNLRNAALNGCKNGAAGFLNTDWGDTGHWQFLPVSYAPLLYGAAVSWGYDANVDLDVPRALDVHVFEDRAGVMGRLAYELGDVYLKSGVVRGNQSFFIRILVRERDNLLSETYLASLTEAHLDDILESIRRVTKGLPEAQMQCADAGLVQHEYDFAIRLLTFTCALGKERVKAGGVPTAEMPADVRHGLAEALRPLIPEFRQLWLARNRSGGLKESAGRFEELLDLLER